MRTARTPERTDVAPVIVGGDIGAYALAREFHEAFGVTSTLVNTGFIGAISHSRICETVTLEAAGPEHVLGAVRGVAAKNPASHVVLVANTDAHIDMLEQAAPDLPVQVVCPIPPTRAFEAVCDKDRFSRLCVEHGLDVPRTQVAHLAGAEPIEPCDLPFPVVCKPAVSAEYQAFIAKGFKKVYFLERQGQLDELWAQLRASGFAGDFLVQELIAGDDTYMDSLTIYVGRDGDVRLLGAAQVLLEDHAPAMLGNPVAMVLRQKDELWAKAGRMLSDAGYWGFANFDIKRDPKTGRELFLDCNPRIGRNSYYNVAGGVNPMEVLVREAVDGKADDVRRASGRALYTLVPVPLLRRYVRDEALLAEVDGLVSDGLVFDPQRYPADWGLRRRLDVELTEANQVRKFARHYPEPTDTSF